MSPRKRGQAGYSLAEMLTVLAIIGALALVAVPSFLTFYQSNKVKASMRNFTSDLRSVRQLAIAQGKQAMLSFGTGTNQRTYDWYLGDKPFNSTTWTPQTGPGRLRATRTLNDIVYFPAAGGSTPQTFADVFDCTTNAPNCTAGQDAKLDVIFRPDGTVQLPNNVTVGTITMKTDLRLPKSQYTVTISPSGRVQAQ